ncbi:MAG: S-layer homology domain-containing protein [Cyanobacteria bacterium P01_D01_bin.115]
MKTLVLSIGSIGLTALSMALVTPGALADPISEPTASMTDVPLPTLTVPVSTGLEMAAPQQAQVLPDGDFADVAPNHWAYSAVNTLTDNYGCLEGYPDGTFRGDELVTRYEFAAEMLVCLNTSVQFTQPYPSESIEQLLEEQEALNSELGTLSDAVEDSESEILVD